MRDDLQRIRDLGFKQVWINPIYTPCQTNPIPKMEKRINSPYAMQNETISSRYAQDDLMVKDYTSTALTLGLEPIFDLVARHVAIDHRFVAGDQELLRNKNIDTRRWFKRHPNGNLVMHKMDENYQPISANPWCDVAAFNYDDPAIKQEIFTYFWEPFIKYNIVDLGFRGVRLDAPAMVPPDVMAQLVKLVRSNCDACHAADPIIIAETLGGYYMEENLALKGTATHTMNSSIWMPGPEVGYENSSASWRNDSNWLAETKGLLQQVGPTVGFPGSHDEARYIKQLMERGIADKHQLELLMCEKMAVSAFVSDGGWILQYGDEFGASERVDVFDPTPIEYHRNLDKNSLHLSDFVRQVNQTIQLLPEPVFPEWSQRVFVESNPNLVIFLVHQGFGFSDNSFMIIANTDLEHQVVVSETELREMMLANGRNSSQSVGAQLPKHLYLCGALEPDRSLVRCLGEDAIHSSKIKAVTSASLFQSESLQQSQEVICEIRKKI